MAAGRITYDHAGQSCIAEVLKRRALRWKWIIETMSTPTTCLRALQSKRKLGWHRSASL